jgi:hypothetical protein
MHYSLSEQSNMETIRASIDVESKPEYESHHTFYLTVPF